MQAEVSLPELRHYSAIWRQIKNKSRCLLEINPAFLKRFKAAIGKEKLNDKLWNKVNTAKLVFTETEDREGKYILVITLNAYESDKQFRLRLKALKHKEISL